MLKYNQSPSLLSSCLPFPNSYATEGDNRIPKIYTKTGDKGCFAVILGKQYVTADVYKS